MWGLKVGGKSLECAGQERGTKLLVNKDDSDSVDLLFLASSFHTCFPLGSFVL